MEKVYVSAAPEVKARSTCLGASGQHLRRDELLETALPRSDLGPVAHLEADHGKAGSRKLGGQGLEVLGLPGARQLQRQHVHAGVMTHDHGMAHIGLDTA